MNNWKLVVTNPSHGSQEYPLDPSRRYTIGRANADVELGFEPLASRKHATLEWSPLGWKLIDELSANGTLVNGNPVNVANMEPGVVALVGTTSLKVMAAGVATHASPTTTSGPGPATTVAGGAGRAQGAGVATQAANQAPKVMGPAVAPEGRAHGAPARRVAVPKSNGNIGALIGIGATALVLIIGVAVAMGGGGAKPVNDSNKTKPVVDAGSSGVGASIATPTGKSVSAMLEGIERDGEPERALAELDMLASVYGRRFTPAEQGRHDRLRTTLVAKVKSSVVTLQRQLASDIKDLMGREDYAGAWSRLDEAEAARVKGSVAFGRMMDETGLTADIAARRNDVTAASNALYANLLKDAFVSEQAGLVEEAVRIVKSIPERVLLDAEKRSFVESRLTQLETAPQIKTVVRRTWREATSARPPWDPVGRRSLNDPDNPESPNYDPSRRPAEVEGGGDAKKPTGAGPAAVAKKPLPPNPLFPMGRVGQEEYMFGVIESIRVGISDGKLKSKQFKRGKQVFEIVSAEDRGLRMRDGDTSIMKMHDWGTFSVIEYEAFLGRLDSLTADNLLGLALISLDRMEDDFARKALLRLITQDPGKKEGVDILLATYEKRETLPEGGYSSFEGSLLHPEAVELILFERKIAGLLSLVEKGLGAREKSIAREKGEAAFQEIIGLGPDAAEPSVRLLQKMRQGLLSQAESATGLAGDTKVLDGLLEELEKRRRHALELIFNEVEWPYPYGPRDAEVRMEVANRVQAVRDIWNNPASVKGSTNPKFEELIAKIKDLNLRLDQVDPNFSHHEATSDADLEYLRQIANQRLDIRKYGKSSSDKSKIAGWYKILDENDAVEKEYEGKPEAPDRDAWEQLRVTNNYRIMMGRNPLKMSFKLYWAAKHHSKWCVDHNGGQISHDSPGGPRGNNVPQRCAFEGYTSGTGENIHMNSGGPSPESAHQSWLSSSGHHRNILNPNWLVMGNGLHQTIWTQVFGNADESKGNQESKGGK